MVNKFDNAMMDTALVWSTLSSCKKLKVGAVIAYNDRIISNGYNGTISGTNNQCEEYRLACECGKLHVFLDIPHMKVIYDTGSNRALEPDKSSLDYYRSIEFNTYRKECECGKVLNFNKKDLILKTNDFTLHAEENAILDAAKHGRKLDGSTIYVTHSPCPTCAKMIAGVGIKKVIYLNDYKDDSGLDYLKKLNIETIKMDELK